MNRQADWGDRVGKAQFKNRYGTPFRGDGWYLLSDGDGQRSAQLSVLTDGKVETLGWFVSSKAECDDLRRTDGDGQQVREETW